MSPLKVGTDSMVLGSFISSDSKLQGLDLGAGTGVLSLMLAQKNQKLQIDAVEIDANVANECDLNFQNSKWRKNLKCISADYLQFEFNKKYDLIFSNPPYHFENTLSPDNGVNISKHSLLSDFIQFFQLVKQLLTENGDFCGTHIKGTPHGAINNKLDESGKHVVKIEIWVQEIKGINYYIDNMNNVYKPEDIISNKQKPAIIAKWSLSDNGVYKIPSFGI